MPAAAVIPALIAYIKVVAVKKLVVGFQGVIHVGKSPSDVWSRSLSWGLPTGWDGFGQEDRLVDRATGLSTTPSRCGYLATPPISLTGDGLRGVPSRLL